MARTYYGKYGRLPKKKNWQELNLVDDVQTQFGDFLKSYRLNYLKLVTLKINVKFCVMLILILIPERLIFDLTSFYHDRVNNSDSF